MARSVVAEVEEEYGEPFWDVVRGYAADNYACDTTARILGYENSQGLRGLIKRKGVVIEWPKHGTCNVMTDRGPRSQEAIKNAQSASYAAREMVCKRYEARTGESVEALVERLRKTTTFTEVARIAGWKDDQGLRKWMKTNKVDAKFFKKQNKPPVGMGFQSKDHGAISFRSANHG
jgi:hypothetical protein